MTWCLVSALVLTLALLALVSAFQGVFTDILLVYLQFCFISDISIFVDLLELASPELSSPHVEHVRRQIEGFLRADGASFTVAVITVR